MRIAMICSCGKRSLDAPPILDVEKVLQDYAWKDFKEKSGPVEKIFLRRRDFEIEVPMNYFHFEDSETMLKTREAKSSKPRSAAGHSVPETSVLQTQFRNNTNNSQTYKFRIERTRKATINVTFQRGFSIGGKAQFKLGLPKALGAGAEVDMRLQVSKTTGETFDETLTFEANSDINVEENCNYTANVAFTEREVSAEFLVQTMMRMPTGTAPVYIRRRRDHELYATVFINDLKDVFSDYKSSAEPIDESSKDAKVARYAIRFTTTGIVEGVRLSGQKIYLDSKKIEKNIPCPETPAVAQSVTAMIAGAGAAHHSGLFRSVMPSDSDDAREDTADRARSITDGQGETRILKAPQIPTIITTAPSSQETSPPSDAGTNTSVESQSIPEDKNDDVFEKGGSPTPSSSSVPVPPPAPVPVQVPVQVPVTVTPKSAPIPSRQSSSDMDDKRKSASSPIPATSRQPTSRQSSEESSKRTKRVPLQETRSLSRGSKDEQKVPHESKSLPRARITKSDSLGKGDSLKIQKTDIVRRKSDSYRSPEAAKYRQEGTKTHNVKSSSSQNLARHKSSSRELTKQSSNPDKLFTPSTHPRHLAKQSSNPERFQKQSSFPGPQSKQSSHPDRLTKQVSNPERLCKQSSLNFPRELIKQMSNPKDTLSIAERHLKEDRTSARRAFKHDTLERLERVSSLSEKPRVVAKSGSTSRTSPRQSLETQSSEEDSVSSLSKLAKCTSV